MLMKFRSIGELMNLIKTMKLVWGPDDWLLHPQTKRCTTGKIQFLNCQ